MPDGTVLLEARDVEKTFGVVRALRGVSFGLAAGEVHGLLGENGAGKSTLIKILTGFYQPDGGEIRLDGTPVRFASPKDAQLAGVAAVYQEINLIPERSVAENLFLGREPRRAGVLIDRRRTEREAAAIFARFGLPIDPRARLGSLGLGLQQMVSIARTASLGARVVIMDEPTSALTAAEVELLFHTVARLKAERCGIVFVSHRLSECYSICDRLTVLRDGASVRSAPTAELPREALVAAMLGGKGARLVERRPPVPTEGDAALSARHMSWRTRVRDVSVEVRPGEVVGLAGLLGSGRTELMKAVYGGERADRGEVAVAGHAIGHPTPRRSIEGGLGFLSEDRRSEGIFPLLSVRENVTASVLDRISRRLVLRRSAEDEIVTRFIRELGIRTSGPAQPIGQLSGGNQQKVLLARALSASPRAIMLDDPTRGIDVGAKAEVHRAIRALAEAGLGVLVTSSEVEELFELCDRLVVLSEGRVAGEVDVADANANALLALLSGGAEAAA